MVALLALGKSLEERIIPFIGHDIVSCPTIMRLVSSNVSCRDIIITKASFADQKNCRYYNQAAGISDPVHAGCRDGRFPERKACSDGY